MRTLASLAIIATVCGLAAPAQAYCPSTPDSAASNYVGHATSRTRCLETELYSDAQRKNELLQLEGRMRSNLMQQELNQRLRSSLPGARFP